MLHARTSAERTTDESDDVARYRIAAREVENSRLTGVVCRAHIVVGSENENGIRELRVAGVVQN
jgi:hypothetical protein